MHLRSKGILLVAMWLMPTLLIFIVISKRATAHRDEGVVSWFEQLKDMEGLKAQDISSIVSEADIPMLRDYLKSPRTIDRVKAAWVLGEIPSARKSAEADLIGALNDGESSVRIASMQALTSLGTTNEALIPELILKLSVNSAEVGYSAAVLIDEIERQRRERDLSLTVMDSYDLATKFAASPVPSVRIRGAYRFARLSVSDGRARESLRAMLDDKDAWVRDRVAVFLKYPDSIPFERLNTAYSP